MRSVLALVLSAATLVMACQEDVTEASVPCTAGCLCLDTYAECASHSCVPMSTSSGFLCENPSEGASPS